MGAKKNITTSEQTNTYQDWAPQNSPDIQAVRDFKDMPEGLPPALQAQFDRAQQRNAGRLASSYNQNIPNSARLAMQANYDRDSTSDYGSALGQSAFDANRLAQARKMGLAEMTMSRPLVSKTSGTQTEQQKGGLWRDLAMHFAKGAGTAATAFA